MKYIAALMLLASPVSAQDTPGTFSLPAGCEAYLTVHDANCTVEHHFICQADPDGYQRRVSLNETGMTYLGAIDQETQWIGSFHARSGHSERLAPNPTERASLTELMETGADDYDFQTLSDEIGTTRYVGRDTLTGRTVTIDGVTLEETEYNMQAFGEDGALRWSSQGNEFISRDWRMFLSGVGTITTPTDTFDKNNTPVEFIFPDEPGFLSSRPKHGCGLAIS